MRNLFTLATIYYALGMLYRRENTDSTEFLQNLYDGNGNSKMLLLQVKVGLSSVYRTKRFSSPLGSFRTTAGYSNTRVHHERFRREEGSNRDG